MATCLGLFCLYWLIIEIWVYKNGNLFSIRTQEIYKLNSYVRDQKHDYLIIGDSTCLYNIVPKVLSESSRSYCLIGSSLYLTKKVLKSQDFSKVQKGIIITQTFIDDHYDSDLWDLLIPNEIVKFKDVLLTSNEPSLILNFTNYLLSKLHLTESSLNNLKQRLSMSDFDFDNYRSNFPTSVQEANGHFPTRNRKLSEQEFYAPKENYSHEIAPPEIERSSLAYILNEAGKYNLPVFFVRTPRLKDSTSTTYDSSVISYLKSFNDSNLKIIDGSYYPALKKADFVDVSHLSGEGAEKYTQHLKIELEAF